jgi:hypothetical protein
MSATGKVQLNAPRSSSSGNGWVCNHSSERWFRRQPAFWAEGASLPKIGPRLCTGPSKQRPPRLPHLAIATGPTRATWYPHSPKNLINCGMGGAAAILRINSQGRSVLPVESRFLRLQPEFDVRGRGNAPRRLECHLLESGAAAHAFCWMAATTLAPPQSLSARLCCRQRGRYRFASARSSPKSSDERRHRCRSDDDVPWKN